MTLKFIELILLVALLFLPISILLLLLIDLPFYIQWLIDDLKIIRHNKEVSKLKKRVKRHFE